MVPFFYQFCFLNPISERNVLRFSEAKLSLRPRFTPKKTCISPENWKFTLMYYLDFSINKCHKSWPIGCKIIINLEKIAIMQICLAAIENIIFTKSNKSSTRKHFKKTIHMKKLFCIFIKISMFITVNKIIGFDILSAKKAEQKLLSP